VGARRLRGGVRGVPWIGSTVRAGDRVSFS
jgi:hypothetical protein